MRRTFALFAAAAFSSLALMPVGAQDEVAVADPTADVTSPVAATVSHVLKSTLFDQGMGPFLLMKSGYWDVGNGTPFSCTAACTVEIEATVAMYGNSSNKNLWAICPVFDNKGVFCPYQGYVPTDKSPTVGNFVWSVSLKAGAHTAQPTVFVSDPATLGVYHIAYRVYQP